MTESISSCHGCLHSHYQHQFSQKEVLHVLLSHVYAIYCRVMLMKYVYWVPISKLLHQVSEIKGELTGT